MMTYIYDFFYIFINKIINNIILSIIMNKITNFLKYMKFGGSAENFESKISLDYIKSK